MKRLLPFLILVVSVTNSFALTASDVLTRARLLLRDSSSDTTRQRFSDAQLLNWLNDGQREANSVNMVLQSSYTFALVSGTTEYVLPTDFIAPWRVTYKGRKINQTSFNQQDANSIGWQTISLGTPQSYYVYLSSSPVIGFIPAPSTSSTGTVVMWYLQQTTDLTATTQVPYNSWILLYPYHSALSYYIAYRGLWTIGDNTLATQYLTEWQQSLAAMKIGIGKQPDFNPGFGGQRN